jgi:predicted MFS family arabinose efflux permease
MTGDRTGIFPAMLCIRHSRCEAAAVGRRLTESLAAFREVFRNRSLRRLQLAWLGSVAGQYSFAIAIAVYAYRHGGAGAVGAIALIRTIPAAVLAPFVSAVGDRYRQERVMLAADILRALLNGAIAVLVLAHGPVVGVFVLAAFGPICSTAFHPAEAALLPVLARSPEELTAANVSSSTIESVSVFAGPAVAGIVLAGWGVGAALLLTVATYLWSAVLIAGVHPERAVEVGEDLSAPRGHWRAEALAGFRAVLGAPRLRLVVGLYGAQTIVAGAMGVLVVVAALRLFDLGSSGVGWLYSACGVGGVVGGAIAVTLVGRQKLAGDFGIGLLLWGVPFVLMGIWPNTVVALAMLGVLGVGNTLVDVSALTLLQRHAPAAVRARVFGIVESLFAATIGLGAILAPILIGLFGIRVALIVTGVFLPVLVALSWRRLAALDVGGDRAHIELLRRIPIFAPLPAPALEGLAGALEPLQLAAGETLFRAGDPGDRFYIVSSGELVIDLATGPKVEGPGGWVGEIALLRDVPRTATVRAQTDVDLLLLERDDFLAAVTGHAGASDVAGQLVLERLALSPV